jgi:hypothetical protein
MSNKRLKQKFYDKPFTGIPLEILKSPAYIALSFSARSLYVELRMRMNGHNNGNINAALSELRHRGFNSPATLAKCLRQLEATKLIAKTRETIGVENGSKVCNLYCLTDIDVLEVPKLNISARKATHPFREIKSLREARQLVAMASPPKKKTSLQSLNRLTTKVVAISKNIDTETEFGLKQAYS